MRKFMSLLLVAGVLLVGIPQQVWGNPSEKRSAEWIEAYQAGTFDPHKIYKLREVEVTREDGRKIMMPILPDDRYYDREFELAGQRERLDAGQVIDRTNEFFEHVVNNAPQSSKGFMVSWLGDCQGIGILKTEATITLYASDGNLYRATMPAGWPVVFNHCLSRMDGGDQKELEAVFACGNKIVLGAAEVEIITVEELGEIEATGEYRNLTEDLSTLYATPDQRPPLVVEEIFAGPAVLIEDPEKGCFPWVWVAAGGAIVALILLLTGGDDEPPCTVRLEDGQLKPCGTPGKRPLGLTLTW